MVFFVLVCLLSLACGHLFAQNTDSLEQELADGKISRQQELNIYKTLSGSLTTKNFDKSIQYGKEGIALATKLKDSVTIGLLHAFAGEAYYFKGQYDTASQYYYTAIAILEKRDKSQTALAFNNLAKLYRKTKDLDKAERYYDKAMELYKAANDSAGVQMIWNESGVVFEYRGDYAEAIRRYTKSMEIARARNDALGESYCLSFIAGVYMLQGKYKESERYVLECLDIRLQLKDTFSIAMTYSDMGSLYIAMKEYAKAEEVLNKSNELSKKLSFAELQSTNYRFLSDLYTQQGKYEQALKYFKMSTGIRDSIFSVAKARQIAELNTQYETGKKEQQIEVQQIAISRRNYIIAGAALVLALGLFLGWQMYRRRQLQEEARLREALLKQQEQASRAVLEAEERERQRIGQDLHDGVGQMMSAAKINLSTFLSDIAIANEEEKIRVDNILSLIDESCKEVRAVSHNMMPNALLKAGLASAVREFVNKIDSRVMEVNLYTEGLDERLDTTIETVLYRVIQECVNNVIKHAQASMLDISIIKDEDGISATIEDNGRGFDMTDNSIRNGIGLKNIETRVQYLKGEVSFDSRPGHGTVVVISLNRTTMV
jgi:signal transduction histidine kinase